MTSQLLTQGATIVLRGAYNPVIFHPAWFAANNLIKPHESEAAKVEIVHPSAAVFTTEWLRINSTEGRFQASTTQDAYYEVLRDLVLGILSLFNTTPLRAMGINQDFQFRLQNVDSWHAVGHRLVPKRDWQDILQNPGMQSLTVEGGRPDQLDGYIRVKVEPLIQVENGLYIEVNDHFQFKTENDISTGSYDAIRTLGEQWQNSINRSKAIAQKIASLGDIQ